MRKVAGERDSNGMSPRRWGKHGWTDPEKWRREEGFSQAIEHHSWEQGNRVQGWATEVACVQWNSSST